MIRLIELKKAKGGSLAYQAATENTLLFELETKLNDLKPTKVHSVTRHDTEHEFGLVAVVEIPEPEKPVQPLSTKTSKEKHK